MKDLTKTENEEILKNLKILTETILLETKTLKENIVNKECKSHIYEKIGELETELSKIKDTLYSNEIGREGLIKLIHEKIELELKNITYTLNDIDKYKNKIINRVIGASSIIILLLGIVAWFLNLIINKILL